MSGNIDQLAKATKPPLAINLKNKFADQKKKIYSLIKTWRILCRSGEQIKILKVRRKTLHTGLLLVFDLEYHSQPSIAVMQVTQHIHVVRSRPNAAQFAISNTGWNREVALHSIWSCKDRVSVGSYNNALKMEFSVGVTIFLNMAWSIEHCCATQYCNAS